jgi:hypothetical protein
MDSERSSDSLLAAWHDGDRVARDALVARMHPELAQIAAARLRAEPNSSLSTGDLINDAIIRLIGLDRIARVHPDAPDIGRLCARQSDQQARAPQG